MNLRQHETQETSDETRAPHPAQNRAWYLSPETTTPVVAPEVTPALFEPSAAERIIARAGALQEVREQKLTGAQIEAVAAEIGIRPEFVRLAIEQEKTVPVSAPRYNVETAKGRRLFPKPRTAVIASLGVGLAYGGLANALLSSPEVYRSRASWWLVFIFPALLALIYGALCRSRRAGAAAGAIIAATVIVSLFISFGLLGNSIIMPLSQILFFVALIASGTLLGTAGAQARRVVSRRGSGSGTKRRFHQAAARKS